MNRRDLMKREFGKTLLRMAEEKPLEDITVSELAKECGVSRGTFYNHFFDIYDLINWMFEVDIVEPLQEYIASHDTSWLGITQQCLERMYEHRNFYCQAVRYTGQNNLQDYMRKRNLDSWKLLIKGYMGETKSFDPDLLDFYERFTADAVANMVIEWAKRGMRTPPERMAHMDYVATRGIYGLIDAANAQEIPDSAMRSANVPKEALRQLTGDWGRS